MRRAFCVLAFGSALLAAAWAVPDAAQADGWRHGRQPRPYYRPYHRPYYGPYYRPYYRGWWGPRVVIGVAPPPPYWGWGYPPPWVAYPPPVIREEPEVYIERPDPPAEGYWHYCESAGGYYPRIPSCPEPWIKVPPTPE
jgi:hypothetical protein